jgi:hypothetical protein
VEKLAELAARSASLREASLRKEAGLFDAGIKAAKGLGSLAVKNPMAALGAGVIAAVAPGAVKGSFKKNRAGFDPAMHEAMHGPPPGV